MAGRSDFQSKFPRNLKRMLSLQSTGDSHVDGDMRRLMIEAHKNHRDYKNRVSKAQVLSYSAKEGTKVVEEEADETSQPVV